MQPLGVLWALKALATALASSECGDPLVPGRGVPKAQAMDRTRVVHGYRVTPRYSRAGSVGAAQAWRVTVSLAVTQPLLQTAEVRGSG